MYIAPPFCVGKLFFTVQALQTPHDFQQRKKGAKKRRNVAVASFLIVFNVIEWSCCVF